MPEHHFKQTALGLGLLLSAVLACSSSTENTEEGGGGSSSLGGSASGGATGSGTAATGGSSTAAGGLGGATVVGSAAVSGGTTSSTSTISAPSGGTTSTSVTPTGGSTGITSTAVTPTGGTTGTTTPSGGTTGTTTTPSGGTTGSTSTTPVSGFVEDDGADCPVASLPDASALTPIAKLPDPFKKLDGTRIAAKADWRCRRAEIRQLAEKFALGTKGKPPTVTGTVSNAEIVVNVTDGSKSASFKAAVSLPKTGSAPFPAVVVYGGFADNETISAAGAAVINYSPYDVGKEGTGRANKQGAYYTIAGSGSTTGLLVAWGWGVSRIIDVIAKSDGSVLKADAVGVTGCSRFGKGAIIAGVMDQRVALTMPIESGTAGVPIWRGIPGEGAQGLKNAYDEQPWFGDAFSAFTSSPTKAPIDTHELLAMVAPRGLFIMDNPHIANLGPKSGHAAALAGAEVYKALGAGENLTYWSDVADGGHCSNRPEWKEPLTKNIQKFLLKTGSYTGAIKAHSKAQAKIDDWVDWTAPTLQ